MAYVPVPKDLNAVKTKVLLNLTKRQLVCFSAGAALGVPLFFLLAMYEKNGQPPEKLIRNIVQVCFLRPKQRPYRTNNFYDLLNRQDILDKEVYAIVHKQKPRKKAHTSRAKADRRGDCKSKASG